MDGCCGGKGTRLRGVWEMLSFFLEGHTHTHNARRGGLCELWPMAISVTLLFRPSGSLVLCFRVVAADLIAGRPNNICSCCLQNTTAMHILVLHVIPQTRANARSPSGIKWPCLLRTPHWGAPICFRASSAPVTSLRPSNMDIDLLGKHPALSCLFSLHRHASLLRF